MGANPNLGSCSYSKPPVIEAALLSKLHCLKLLVEFGVDLKTRSNDGHNIFSTAINSASTYYGVEGNFIKYCVEELKFDPSSEFTYTDDEKKVLKAILNMPKLRKAQVDLYLII